MREGIARLTLVLGAVMATGPLALDMYLPALPTLEAEFAASTARVQHTVSAYLFGMGLGQLAFGPLTDRFGRKRPLLLGLGIFALASAGCALAHSIDSFALLRFMVITLKDVQNFLLFFFDGLIKIFQLRLEALYLGEIGTVLAQGVVVLRRGVAALLEQIAEWIDRR